MTKGKRAAIIAAVIAIVVACAGVGVLQLFASGALAPAGAAAKYNWLSYIQEKDATDYIVTYKEQMGFADASDEEWAQFLAAYNLTPERLRYSTVQQLVCDRLIDDWGRKLNIQVSDEDLETYLQSMRNAYAFGDNDLWTKTLAQYGQTEQGLREAYRHTLVRQRVFSAEVPMPSVDNAMLQQNLLSVTSGFASPVVRHSYCFKVQGLDDDGSFTKRTRVENARKALLETGVSKENFEALTTSLSDVESLVTTGGANGWSCDPSGYTAKYAEVLEATPMGQVSDVFVDGDGYAFLWVDEEVTLPSTQAEAQSFDVASLPTSLHDYLADSVAYAIWQQYCSKWLDDQVQQANVVLFPMPADVPYNVAMQVDDQGNPVVSG